MSGMRLAVAVVLAIAFTQSNGAAVGPCEFVCPMSVIQVCGSDGNTYDSECDLRRTACVRRSFNKLTVAHEGPCESGDSRRALKPCEFVCPLSLVPVCGSDGNNYDSECDLKRVACVRKSVDKLTMAHEGPCEKAVLYGEPKSCEFVCPLSLKKVCGSDGQTYDSECDLERIACVRRSLNTLIVAYEGPCPEAKPCEFVCPLSLNPVCGSDGQTYDSACDLKRAACVRRSLNGLTVAYEGPCTKAKPCEFVCPMSLVPVCGSDGQTYDSECDLKRRACVRRSLNKLTMAHEGPCETATPFDSKACSFMCHFSLVPVCGSDGHTYLNECDLKQISCKRRSLNKLTVAHIGPCECDLVFCRYSEIPVCGTDGNTYDNECDLKKSACRKASDISVKSQGPCIH